MCVAMAVPMPQKQPLKGQHDLVVGILLASGLHLVCLWFMACRHNEIIHLIGWKYFYTRKVTVYDPWSNEEGHTWRMRGVITWCNGL